jgi:hypothetical protein
LSQRRSASVVAEGHELSGKHGAQPSCWLDQSPLQPLEGRGQIDREQVCLGSKIEIDFEFDFDFGSNSNSDFDASANAVEAFDASECSA